MISGFTLVRNATKLDYPFEESIQSLIPLCDEVIINVGDSEDDTLEIAQKLEKQFPDKIRILQTQWERLGQSGGFQLKKQTDYALEQCKGQWCLYLQADEVLHEADYPLVRKTAALAEKDDDIDGVLFDYLHFYGSYEWEIRGRNWYRREVRLIKNGRNIRAFRDAQGFRKDGKRLQVIRSGARVFHYGYVRNSASLKTKSKEMATWWGNSAPDSNAAYELKRHIGLRRFQGTHAAVMKRRIGTYRGDFDPKNCRRSWDTNELKNLVTFVWESIVPFRIGEFRNYEVKK